MYSANVDGCSVGMTNSHGQPILKPWRIITSCKRLADHLNTLTCNKLHKHGETLRQDITATGKYPLPLCHAYLSSLFGSYRRTHAMPLVAHTKSKAMAAKATHRSRDCESPLLICPSPAVAAAFVHKLLDRKDWQSNPKARAAVRTEADALVGAGTWSYSTVMEKDQLIANAKRDKTIIHLGELLQLCSVKHAELPPDQQKLKGRICYRGG